MNELIKKIGLAGLRHLLTYGGGFLVGNGIINGTQESDLIGACMTIVGIAWSAWEAHANHKITETKDLTGKTVPTVPVIDGGPLPPV